MRRIQFLRNHFFTGLLVLNPSAVIGWICIGALRALWGVHTLLPEYLWPEASLGDSFLATLLNIVITLALAGALAAGISLLGWASKKLFRGKKFFSGLER